VTEQIATRQMNPNARRVVEWRTWDQQQFVTVVDFAQVFRSRAEDGAVDCRPEAVRSTGRKRRWRRAEHVG
jgi:hypothetical protein